jgi:hypothetical protein
MVRMSVFAIFLLSSVLIVPSFSYRYFNLKVYDGKIYAMDWKGTRDCRIIASSDSGKSWDSLTQYLPQNSGGSFVWSGITDYAVTRDTLLMSRWDGIYQTPLNAFNLTKRPYNIADSSFAFLALRDSLLLTVAAGGLYRISLESGQSIKCDTSLKSHQTNYLAYTFINHMAYVSSWNRFCRSNEPYIIWDSLQSPDGPWFALASIGTKLFAGTYAGAIYASDDQGASWTEKRPGCYVCSAPQLFSLQPVFGKGIAGTATGYAFSSDSGESWQNVQSRALREVNSVVTCGRYVYAASDSGIFISTDTCKTWFALPDYFDIAVERALPVREASKALPLRISVYNLKGQLLRAFSPSNRRECDYYLQNIRSNGVYLEKILYPNSSRVRKVIRLK